MKRLRELFFLVVVAVGFWAFFVVARAVFDLVDSRMLIQP